MTQQCPSRSPSTTTTLIIKTQKKMSWATPRKQLIVLLNKCVIEIFTDGETAVSTNSLLIERNVTHGSQIRLSLYDLLSNFSLYVY